MDYNCLEEVLLLINIVKKSRFCGNIRKKTFEI